MGDLQDIKGFDDANNSLVMDQSINIGSIEESSRNSFGQSSRQSKDPFDADMSIVAD